MDRGVESNLYPIGRRIALLAALSCLAACNDELGTGSGSSSSTPANGSPAGIWTGTDSATGMQMIGLINSSGAADFFFSNGEQFVGTAQVAGTAIAISLDGYTQFNAQFSDGSTYGVGTFNGTLTSASSITGTLSFTTSNNTASTSSWSLTFSSLYDTAESLSSISGSYTGSTSAVSAGLDPLSGASVTLSSTGTLFAQGPTSGCVANGTIASGDTSYNIFEVTYTLESCTGTYVVLNGITFSGLAYVNTSDTPAQIVVTVTGQGASSTYYGVVSDLTSS
jgi:hypothetical protein